jgi:uncharacterized protein involved in exopolysaccharide biosynthesis
LYQTDTVDDAYERVQRSISVRVEPLTDLIRVSFRHKDPKIAAEFVGQVVNSFLSRHAELSSNLGAVSFVERQKTKYTQEFERASAEFGDFARQNGVYALDKQRDLLLNRRSNLLDSVASTHGLIAEKEAQARELAAQLTTMKLTGVSPQISALARGARQPQGRNGPKELQAQDEATDTSVPFTSNDPPLLLVRVYQDTVQVLVRTNSELAGLRSLGTRQRAELDAVGEELRKLSEKETEFFRLKQDVDVASHSADLFARKAVEQEVDAALTDQKFSRLQVAQEATKPLRPVSPNRIAFLGGGILAGLLLMAATTFLVAFRRVRNQERAKASAASTDGKRNASWAVSPQVVRTNSDRPDAISPSSRA